MFVTRLNAFQPFFHPSPPVFSLRLASHRDRERRREKREIKYRRKKWEIVNAKALFGRREVVTSVRELGMDVDSCCPCHHSVDTVLYSHNYSYVLLLSLFVLFIVWQCRRRRRLQPPTTHPRSLRRSVQTALRFVACQLLNWWLALRNVPWRAPYYSCSYCISRHPFIRLPVCRRDVGPRSANWWRIGNETVKLESESESDAALAAAKLPVRIFSSFSLSSLPSIFCLLLLLLQAVNLAKLWFIIASQSKCENLPFACLLATM